MNVTNQSEWKGFQFVISSFKPQETQTAAKYEMLMCPRKTDSLKRATNYSIV